MIKGKLPPWTSPWGEHTNIASFLRFNEQRPLYGFVYMLLYEDGKAYIGKKNFYTIRTLPKLRNNQEREGHIRFGRTTELVERESKWKTYTSSHKECKNRKPIKRLILEIASNKKHLTYLEAKALFDKNVLTSPNFLNDNILGKFFRKDFKYETNTP